MIQDNSALGMILLDRLEAEPEAEACRLVNEDGTFESVSVKRLMQKAMAYAERFGPATESRKVIGISLYHGLDLHAAFIGGLLAGHIPTMLAPPSPRMEKSKYTDSLVQMLRHIRPEHLVVDAGVYAGLNRLAIRDVTSSDIIDTGAIPESGGFSLFRADVDDVALVQHSSGTTGLQKGVALSHRAILAHNRIYSDRLEIGRREVIVSWLPLYHDMGFVACYLLPLLQRILLVEISPFDWVRKPVLLLEQIHRHAGTLCWLPNFAYSFMADSVRPHQIPADLDLSGVRAWINCSEPIRHSSHAAFMEKFSPYGVGRHQLTASYAMAENVFAVTQSVPGNYRTISACRQAFTNAHRIEPDDGPDSLTFVSNGRPLEGTEIAVAGEAGDVLPEGHVGELMIRGVHRFSGYFGRDDLTLAAIDGNGWYCTGDLGFLLEGELYVTGRKKDLIIIQGRNFYPTDVEAVVEGVEGVTAGRVVAFGIPDEASGTERLIVLAETRDEFVEQGRQIALRVRNRVAQELDCTPGDVRIVPQRWLVKSTSGKFARADNRSKYLAHFAPSQS